jgi:succinoglycan biosynthesis transport protein ExoP
MAADEPQSEPNLDTDLDSDSDSLDEFPADPQLPGAILRLPRLGPAAWVGLAAFVVFLALASLAVYRWMNPRVTVDALLYIERHPWRVVSPPDIPPWTAEDDQDFQAYCRTQEALVKSRLVLSAALRDSAVANLRLLREQPDPVAWLEDHLTVDFQFSPDIMRVSLSLRGESAEDLKAIVGAVAKKYMDEIVFKEHNKRLDQLDKLKALKRKYEEMVAAKKRSLQEVVAAADSDDAPDVHRKQERARADLQATEKELASVHLRVLRLKAGESFAPNQPIPEATLMQQIDQDPRIKAILDRIGVLEMEKIEADAAPQKDPQLRERKQAVIDTLQKYVDARRAKIKPQVEKELRLKYKTRAEEQKRQVEMLTRSEAILGMEIDRLGREARPGNRRRDLTLVDQLREEVEQLEEVLKRISWKCEVLDVDQDTPPRVRMFEPEPVVRKDK